MVDLLILAVVVLCSIFGGCGILIIMFSGPLRTYALAYMNDDTLLGIAAPSGRLHLLRVTEDRAGHLLTSGGLEFEITPGSGYNLGGVPLFFADLTFGLTQRLDIAQYAQAATMAGILSVRDALDKVDVGPDGKVKNPEAADVKVNFIQTVSFAKVANYLWDIGPGTIQNKIELEVAEVLRQNRNIWNSGFAMFAFVLLIGVGVFYIMVNNSDAAVFDNGVETGEALCEARYSGMGAQPRTPTGPVDRPPLVTVKPTR